MKIISLLEKQMMTQYQEPQTEQLQPSMLVMLPTEHQSQELIFVKVCDLQKNLYSQVNSDIR